MLPVLCGMHLFCGWILRSLRPDSGRIAPPSKAAAGGLGAGTRLLAKLPYLRHLALLVLVGAAGATMIDQVFKTQAQLAFPQREALLRFFALFYTAASLAGWVIHTALTRLLLEKSGLGVTVSVLPATVTLGSLGAALLTGLPSASIARGSEQVAHNTLFRSAYELFYTSVPPAEKRSAKQIIDVGFERLGDMLGAVINRGLLWLIPLNSLLANPAMLGAAAIAGLFGFWIARRLDRGYVLALERSLRDRAVELNLEEVEDHTTRATLMRTMPEWQAGLRPRAEAREEEPPAPLDPVLGRITELRSGDPKRVRKALEQAPLEAPLAAHVIPLLAWDDVAEDAQRALRRAGSGISGQLIDAMLDSSQDFAVRRRVPRLLAALPSARSMEALFLGLNDKRFEVRFRCGKALARLLDERCRAAPRGRSGFERRVARIGTEQALVGEPSPAGWMRGRRTGGGARQPRPRTRFHVAQPDSAERAPAAFVPGVAHGRRDAAGNGAGVPGKHPASADHGTVVALPRRQTLPTERAAQPRRDPGGTPALA